MQKNNTNKSARKQVLSHPYPEYKIEVLPEVESMIKIGDESIKNKCQPSSDHSIIWRIPHNTVS